MHAFFKSHGFCVREYNKIMNFVISAADSHGYPFGGSSVLVICMPEQEAHLLFTAVRGRSSCRYDADVSIAGCTADEICILSEESWYALRFHSFQCSEGHLSFVMYFMKAQYMATAGLLGYRKKSRFADTHDREYFLFSDKVDESCQHAEYGSGNDIVGIVDTAENPDESFAGSCQKKQDADLLVDLQDGHGNDHA